MNIQMIDAPMGEGKAELFKETKSSSKLHEDIPTLASSAMIVEVNISNWTGRKKDKAASKDVTTRNNANDGVASVHKALLADNSDLCAVSYTHLTLPTIYSV